MTSGTLFVVATPIGNLRDITLRALDVLEQVSVIAAEDTRSAQHLLHAHGLWPRPQGKSILSYFQGNEAKRTPELIAMLQHGHDVALISEAGLPGISDPGQRLIQATLTSQLKVSVIPGPCAAVTALVGSGMDTNQFLFIGFPPRKQQERHHLFASVANIQATLIFYESPSRLYQTLVDLSACLGPSRVVCVARELTKVYEEFRRGDLTTLITYYEQNPPRGEVTLLVEGAIEQTDDDDSNIETEIRRRLISGQPPKEIALAVALRFGKSKRQVYQLTLHLAGEANE